jgi:hypothetical protein
MLGGPRPSENKARRFTLAGLFFNIIRHVFLYETPEDAPVRERGGAATEWDGGGSDP